MIKKIKDAAWPEPGRRHLLCCCESRKNLIDNLFKYCYTICMENAEESTQYALCIIAEAYDRPGMVHIDRFL
ncbi:hypothetical protein D5274_01335 [bacterium 1XD42-94]|nr:hypothetical protein [bacterium 1XD42-76]NBK03848.1 hypothetical protein [bacterium 1XD42-94]